MTSARAQNPSPQTPVGWYATVQSASGAVTPSSSYAVVDATQYTGSDLCAKINSVFSTYNRTTANGIVVDARGFSGSALICGATSPWDNLLGGGSSGFSNTVLLPAGTITIQKSWILPNWTRLIGQGPKTTLVTAASGFTSDLIDMGTETNPANNSCLIASGVWDCPGIVIEHLGIVGSGSGNGIVNCCAQELSRVSDVSISNVTTGLALTDMFAQNSGPYTNLTISAVNKCLVIGPAMATNIMTDTRGVHGLACSVSSTASLAAITIDGPNNSLEDISISGASKTTTDGILIGSQASAQGNTLFNIQGSGLKNVVHLSNHSATSVGTGNCPFPSNTVYNVCDITIFGVNAGTGTNAVQDDLTGSTIVDSTVAMYVLGEIVAANTSNIGYSRYTTALATGDVNTTPWLVGPNAPPAGSCPVGTLYSCTGSSTSCTRSGVAATLWECVGGSTQWTKVQ